MSAMLSDAENSVTVLESRYSGLERARLLSLLHPISLFRQLGIIRV